MLKIFTGGGGDGSVSGVGGGGGATIRGPEHTTDPYQVGGRSRGSDCQPPVIIKKKAQRWGKAWGQKNRQGGQILFKKVLQAEDRGGGDTLN